MRDATQPWPISHPSDDLWLLRSWPVTPDLTAWLIAECLWFMSIFSAWLMGQQVALPRSKRGKYCKRGARQCKGLCRGKAFCLKMAPTLVEPYIILTFLNVAGLWLSVALLLERLLLKVLCRLMHTKESHALIFVNSLWSSKGNIKTVGWGNRGEVTHAKICSWVRILLSVKESSDKGWLI